MEISTLSLRAMGSITRTRVHLCGMHARPVPYGLMPRPSLGPGRCASIRASRNSLTFLARRGRVLSSANRDDTEEAYEIVVSREEETLESSLLGALESSATPQFLNALLSDIEKLNGELDVGRAAIDESKRLGEAVRAEDIEIILAKERRLAILEVRPAVLSCANLHDAALSMFLRRRKRHRRSLAPSHVASDPQSKLRTRLARSAALISAVLEGAGSPPRSRVHIAHSPCWACDR